MKVIFDVAEKLELPVTRSWYMYGSYVWSDYATESRMNDFWSIPESDPSIKDTIEQARTAKKDLFAQIKRLVEDHELMLDIPLSDFLDKLYERAPRRYRNVYKTHKKVLLRFRSISELSRSCIPEPQLLKCSRDITAFQKEMLVFNEFPDMVDLVIEHTSFMEDLMVRFDESLDEPVRLQSLISFFKDAYEAYRNKTWTFPPSLITIENITGDNKETVIETRKRHMSQLPYYMDLPDIWREKAFSGNFYPSYEGILESQKKLAVNSGNSERFLKEYFTRQREPAARQD